jgi:hypothetical protein
MDIVSLRANVLIQDLSETKLEFYRPDSDDQFS